jgi:hypothetical protein
VEYHFWPVIEKGCNQFVDATPHLFLRGHFAYGRLVPWAQWDPGVLLQILHTEYSSVVEPIVAFIDEARADSDQQIVVLIPVVIPNRFRYRILHNQVDRVLSSALRTRTDLVVARVAMPLQDPQDSVVLPIAVGGKAATREIPGTSSQEPTG